nr:hypothetical protein [Mycoplasmopsis agalactiae]
MNKYAQLFRSFKLGSYTLKNRFVLSPMTLSLATKDGKVTTEEEKYSARRADCAPLLISGEHILMTLVSFLNMDIVQKVMMTLNH